MCSYHAPNMLFPPQELMALAGIVKEWKKGKVDLLDAMAEQLNLEQTLERIGEIKPDIIVTITGFSCFEDDMETFDAIHRQFPEAVTVVFGHYATQFFREILQRYSFHYVIMGEPDMIFSKLYDAITGTVPVKEVEGIAYKPNGELIIQEGEPRIAHPEELPMPAYDLLKPDCYFEPFMEAPFGLIQSARGCPYSCNYCVKSFGRRLTYRTPQQIIDEIIFLKKHHGIRSLRFIDDTFTVSTKRVIEVCQLMIENELNISWTCLSRVDSLKPEMLPWMQKAGCKRIYFGIESGSPKVLAYLDKEGNPAEALASLKACKKYDIETLGFFLVGAPVETDEDHEMSVRFAREAELDYVVVSELMAYPGTPLFDQVKAELDFSVLPYRNRWRDPERRKSNMQREKDFYKRFYLRPAYAVRSAKRVLKHPVSFAANSMRMLRFLLRNSSPTLKRRDYM